jgi:hypothetical protein
MRLWMVLKQKSSFLLHFFWLSYYLTGLPMFFDCCRRVVFCSSQSGQVKRIDSANVFGIADNDRLRFDFLAG